MTSWRVINRTQKLKSPEPDKIHNFWIKKFNCVHTHLLKHLNKFVLNLSTFPTFLCHGVTYLKPKDNDTTNPLKYRPITCLPTIYKISKCRKEDLLPNRTITDWGNLLERFLFWSLLNLIELCDHLRLFERWFSKIASNIWEEHIFI